MKTKTIGRVSLLGLILTTTSGVIAAIMHEKKDERRAKNGYLRVSSLSNIGILTCIAGSPYQCTVTGGTVTSAIVGSAESVISVNGIKYQTVGNTSQGAIQSVLVPY